MTAATLVKEARRAAGMTQAQLAERLGVRQPVVARLERTGSNPTWDTLVRALRAMDHEVKLNRITTGGPDVDRGQLRERLKLTPAERLEVFQRSQHELVRLQRTARRVDR